MKQYFLFLLFIGLSFSAKAQASFTHNYIHLINGDTVYGKSVNYEQSFLGKGYLKLNQSERYDLDQVQGYGNEYGEFIYRRIPGSMKKRILTKESSGKISLYSRTTSYSSAPVMTSGSAHLNSPSYFFQKEKLYIQDSENPEKAQKLTFKKLKTAVANNPESMRKVKKVKRLRILSSIFYSVGAGLVSYELVSYMTADSRNDNRYDIGNSYIPVAGIIGTISCAVPITFKNSKKHNIKEAIKIYNR